MTKKLPSLTIGIPAYNEEGNIINIIESIQRQKVQHAKITSILVICDGCTDDTVRLVSKYRSSKHKLKMIVNPSRKGKAYRLNQVFKSINTDIFIQVDSDIIFENEQVLDSLIKKISSSTNEVLAAGNTIPLKPITFTEKAIMSTFNLYYQLRYITHGGNNIYSADGKLMGYSKKLYKKMHFPKNLISEDAYGYLFCFQHKYTYLFATDAVVRYRLPNTLIDQIKQNSRFLAGVRQLDHMFDVSMMSRAYLKPKGMFVVGLMKAFIKNPILTVYIKIINLYCKLLSSHEEYNNAKWDVSASTKRGIV